MKRDYVAPCERFIRRQFDEPKFLSLQQAVRNYNLNILFLQPGEGFQQKIPDL